MKRLAVLGHPVSHSRSPAMQNAALEALGLGGEWSYEAIEIEPGEFAERTGELPAQGFVGANVTIPHKEAALALAGEASKAAEQIGAANTLSFVGGVIRADNTDASGLLAALPGPVQGRSALVLGAGGSARAAVWALAGEGASVSVWNRSPERADQLVRDLAHALHKTGCSSASPAEHPRISAEGRLRAVTREQVRANGYQVIVNCTAIGMRDEDPFEHLPLDPERLDRGILVADLVYGGSEGRLVQEARNRGATAVEGLEVLVRQGAESLRIWTGTDPPLEVMRQAARGDQR
jgi:shikimate dehydrogenase